MAGIDNLLNNKIDYEKTKFNWKYAEPGDVVMCRDNLTCIYLGNFWDDEEAEEIQKYAIYDNGRRIIVSNDVQSCIDTINIMTDKSGKYSEPLII